MYTPIYTRIQRKWRNIKHNKIHTILCDMGYMETLCLKLSDH